MADFAALRGTWANEEGYRVTLGAWARPVPGGWSLPCAAPILGCAWSADGRRVAVASGGNSAGADGTVLVLDVREGTSLRLLGHRAGTHGVAFDPATGWLATAGHDGSIGLWDLDRGAGFGVHGPVSRHRVAFARTRHWLAFAEEVPPAGERASVGWLDLAGGRLPWCHPLPPEHLATALAIDPTAAHVAIGLLRYDGHVNQVSCYETPSGRRTWRLDVDTKTLVHDLRWTTAGVVQSDSDAEGVRRLRVLDPETGVQRVAVAVGESVMGGLDVAGDLVASVGSEGEVVLRRLPDLAPAGRVDLAGLPSMAVALAPDGGAVAVGAADGRGLLVRRLTPP